jgi:hypothetical protein
LSPVIIKWLVDYLAIISRHAQIWRVPRKGLRPEAEILKNLSADRQVWRMTEVSVIKLIIFISPPHFGQVSGSISHIFLIHSLHVFDGIRFGSYPDTSIISTLVSFSTTGSSPGLTMTCFRRMTLCVILTHPEQFYTGQTFFRGSFFYIDVPCGNLNVRSFFIFARYLRSKSMRLSARLAPSCGDIFAVSFCGWYSARLSGYTLQCGNWWRWLDSNQRLCGYEPHALTN